MRRSAFVQYLIVFGLSSLILALNIWLRYFKHLSTVLIFATILAFLLNYPVQRLERICVTRAQVVIIVLLVILAVFSVY